VEAVNDNNAGNVEEENAGQWSTAEVTCLLTLWGEESVQDKSFIQKKICFQGYFVCGARIPL